MILAKSIYTTLCQFEDDLHENQTQFHSVLDSVVEAEMQLYQDMAVLQDIEKRNEKTKKLVIHCQEKIGVVEESQKYILGMLTDLEDDLK